MLGFNDDDEEEDDDEEDDEDDDDEDVRRFSIEKLDFLLFDCDCTC